MHSITFDLFFALKRNQFKGWAVSAWMQTEGTNNLSEWLWINVFKWNVWLFFSSCLNSFLPKWQRSSSWQMKASLLLKSIVPLRALTGTRARAANQLLIPPVLAPASALWDGSARFCWARFEESGLLVWLGERGRALTHREERGSARAAHCL